MSVPQKEWLSKWLPLLVAVAGNAVLFGVFYGRTNAELGSLRAEMMPMEKRLEVFYTRREAQAMLGLIQDTNSKVDLLYQRELVRK